jgi:DNA-3-methyladenine glycosylase II
MLRYGLTDESLARGAKLLASRDKHLARILHIHGLPPLWARRPGFATLIRIILEQQVSLASAAAIAQRLRENIVPFKPELFLKLGETKLRSLGLTRQKTSYCLQLSQSIIEKCINLSVLRQLPDEEAKELLLQIKGIGPWSADIYLLMALRRPDIWPAGDLALATAIGELKQLEERPTPVSLFEIADSWRPFRAVAARMLWQYYLARRGRK